jgi:copper homeostasis protein (lipoprotein)
MKYILLLTCLIIYACNSNKGGNKETDSTANKPKGFEVKKFAGVFFDTLPCADCPGIVTQLYLKPDNSFIMEQAYLGKSVVYDLGKWSVTDSILKLTGSEGPRQFKVVNFAVIKLLDNEGRMIDDTTNAHIILSRINTPFKPLQPIPVEGIFSANGDTMNIHICAVDNNYPVALSPGALGMKATYNKAVHPKNEPIYTKLEGHFELRPSLTDTSTKDFFVVERFIKFIPGQQCK